MARHQLIARSQGRSAILHEEDGKTYIQHIQDAEPIIEFAAAARREPRHRERGDEAALGTRVAIVPKSELDRAFIEGWADDPDAWRRWYAENPLYRTTDLRSI